MTHHDLKTKPITIFILNIIAYIVAYYISILLHEWGHGTVAWLYGVKSSPFAIHYGGWLLLHVDEHVNYTSLIQSGAGTAAALIGIAGGSVSLILLLCSFVLLHTKKCKNNPIKFIIVYWFLIINMVPLVQYLCVSTFSSQGDTGEFIHGLNISPWWVFLPGTIFVALALWRILGVEIIKAYVVMPVKSIPGQSVLLLFSLATIFLFIYTHGYNPFSDSGSNIKVYVLAMFSIILAPALFILCNPMQKWVKKAVAQCKQKINRPYS